MKRYETIFITYPELSEEGLSEIDKKLRSILASMKGDIIKFEDWGVKKLAYEIRKNSRGRYFLLDYLGAADLVRELERNLRLNDQILKFHTVRVGDWVSPEAAKKLKEEAQAEKGAPGSVRSTFPEEKMPPVEERPESERGEGK